MSLLRQKHATALAEHKEELLDLQHTRYAVEHHHVDQLVPAEDQPRWSFEDIESLAVSIRERGVLQPLVVRPHPNLPGKFQIVAGERRWRASKAAARELPARAVVPCIVRSLSDEDAAVVSSVENFHRADLNPYERAAAIVRLLALRWRIPAEEVPATLHRLLRQPDSHAAEVEQAEAVFQALNAGNWRSFTTNQLGLLNLTPALVDAMRGGLPYSKARALAVIDDDQVLRELLHDVVSQGLSVAQIRERVRAWRDQASPANSRAQRLAVIRRLLADQRVQALPAAKQEKLDGLLSSLEALLRE